MTIYVLLLLFGIALIVNSIAILCHRRQRRANGTVPTGVRVLVALTGLTVIGISVALMVAIVT